VVKVVEAQPSLLVLDEASPLADWARLDTEQLAELIKVCVGVGGKAHDPIRRVLL
jgi:hypothetical protein